MYKKVNFETIKLEQINSFDQAQMKFNAHCRSKKEYVLSVL